jgi:hypothetical protein
MGPDGERNQERLYWRGPAAIYRNGLDSFLTYRTMEQQLIHTTTAQAEMRNKISRENALFVM